MFNRFCKRSFLSALLIGPLIPLNVFCQQGKSLTDFNGEKAYEHVKKLVEFGPRPPGSDAIKKSQAYIQAELKSYGLKVSADSFEAQTPRGTVQMLNIVAEL